MVVWDLPDDQVDGLGERMGRLPFVTLCYRRPRRLPDWPYNLFTMIHGRDRESVLAQVEIIKEALDLREVPCAALFSGRRFKQRGARYGARATSRTRRAPPASPRQDRASTSRPRMFGRCSARWVRGVRFQWPGRCHGAASQVRPLAATDPGSGPAAAVISPLARAFLNRYQGGFPLCERPFQAVAAALDTDEQTLIGTLRGLLESGVLSRFGPLYDAERLGGCLTLAAMAVPEPEFDRVAALLVERPEVAHNYRRDHPLNMWFVLATPSEPSLQQSVRAIQALTGLPVYDFPKLAEYHLGFWLHLGEDGSVGVRRVERGRSHGVLGIDTNDRALIAATQAGLLAVPEPYGAVASDLGWESEQVIERLGRLLAGGGIRRIGAVPNHYRLGLRGNGMTVWDIEDDAIDRLGGEVGRLDGVTHCYRRPRRLPLWPYNLFAMVHGRDRAEVLARAARIESSGGWPLPGPPGALQHRGAEEDRSAIQRRRLTPMFRLSRYLHLLAEPERLARAAAAPPAHPSGPVVIWNLIRRCNLTCRHCYSTSADKAFTGELTTAEAMAVMEDLRAFGVPVLVLSGGEPLMRPDLFDLAHHAKSLGFYLALSTNGTLIDEDLMPRITAVGFDYLGISLDGLAETHDRFRRRIGAFQASLEALRLCRDAGVKVGLRFTLTRDNARDLPALLELMRQEDIPKFYLSHLNYAGRGNKNRRDDAHFRMTRDAMDLLIETTWSRIQAGRPVEMVTGNNDADGVYLLEWTRRHFPERAADLCRVLTHWGGNASGQNIANIDNLGHVHPDTFWWDHPLGDVRERPFSAIWEDRSDPLMAGLKQRPRPVTGRCADCAHLAICNGNTRTRAFQVSGDFWAEDPGCYLTDAEIGLASERDVARAVAGGQGA